MLMYATSPRPGAWVFDEHFKVETLPSDILYVTWSFYTSATHSKYTIMMLFRLCLDSDKGKSALIFKRGTKNKFNPSANYPIQISTNSSLSTRLYKIYWLMLVMKLKCKSIEEKMKWLYFWKWRERRNLTKIQKSLLFLNIQSSRSHFIRFKYIDIYIKNNITE